MLIHRALAALTIAAGVLTPSVAAADHITPPGQNDGLTIGFCHVYSSGWKGAACVGGRRPYLAAREYSGTNRAETAVLLAEHVLAGTFTPGTVFVARWEDLSAAVMAATLTDGTWVQVPGGDGPLSPTSRQALLAAHATITGLVFVGGDGAIGVSQRVEVAQTVWWGQ